MWKEKNYASDILYPAISEKIVELNEKTIFDKSKQILSVGRFFSTGHSKNQHIIADLFKQCVDAGSLNGWELVLVGSSNDDKYVQFVTKSLSGYNAKILTNISLDELKSYYRSASIYIHAAGYGQDINKEPENFEHFGMTVVEAAMNGCLPVVYNQAGPKEIVEKLGIGNLYDTIEQAVEFFIERNGEFDRREKRNLAAEEIRSKAKSLFYTSSSPRRREAILSVFGLDKIDVMSNMAT
ncbi:glycosyltransferase [Methylobacterium sp. J-088]|uniref:glycosyltransferase n=1 Tax=Methylobacterium sp. J-088 TaxID=2836664 RepID=UPI001FBACCC9|nr:glycosyltransferase [Methylobacterium sp. J-088]MCJ2066317.1 glycosyltransferase [Methylobacterium sp. J-088]